MKGAVGLLVAFGMAVVGAVCNWMYINGRAADLERIQFITVKPQTRVELGDVFQKDHFVPVGIPRRHMGNLDSVAPEWDALATVVGRRATRNYTGGEIVLHADLKSPDPKPLNMKIGDNERVMWLPVDTRSINPQRINPDDQVSFILPALTADGSPAPANAASGAEIVGPFRILEIGSRTGSTEVYEASGVRRAPENTIAIAAKLEGGQLDKNAQKISDVLRMTRFQGIQVLLHPANPDE